MATDIVPANARGRVRASTFWTQHGETESARWRARWWDAYDERPAASDRPSYVAGRTEYLTQFAPQAGAGRSDTMTKRSTKPVAADTKAAGEQTNASDVTGAEAATAVAEEALPEGRYEPAVALELVDTHPDNRKHVGPLDELAADIRQKSVLQPVLLRPNPEAAERFQIVAGERRYRASLLAERTTIPAIVRDLSDRQVADIQLVENLQREDLHPLDEATLYRRMMERHGYSALDLAHRVSKSDQYVYNRVNLLSLCDEVQAEFYLGHLVLANAQLLARIPEEERQRAALKALRPRDASDWPGPKEARRVILQFHWMDLSRAPFDTTDATLAPQAGACAVCPWRTGNQGDLFGEPIGDKNLCTKVTCFERKVAASQMRAAAAASERGLRVLNDKERSRVFGQHSEAPGSDSVSYDSPYRLLDEQVDPYGYGAGARTWRETLGKDVPPPSAVVAAPSGKMVEVWSREDLAAAARRKGVKLGGRSGGSPSRSTPSPADKRAALEARIESATATAVLAAISEKAATALTAERELALWPILAHAAIDNVWHDARKRVAARRELDTKKSPGNVDATLRAHLKTLDPAGARAFSIELFAAQAVGNSSKDNRCVQLAEALGVKVEPLRTAARKRIAEKSKPAPKAAPPAAKVAKPKAKKRAGADRGKNPWRSLTPAQKLARISEIRKGR